MAAYLLSLREGVEAALVIGILLGALRRLGSGHGAPVRAIWLGAATAAVASALLALLLGALRTDLAGRAQAAFEGATLLLAATVLTWMIFWMREQGKHMGQRLSGEIRQAALSAQGGSGSRSGQVALFSVAFLAVVREGVELALFLAAAAFATSGHLTVAGALLGLATAAALGALLFAGTIRLSLNRFFLVTSLVLVLFAAGMVAYGVHELVEGGFLPGFVTPLWDSAHVLNEGSPLGQLSKALLGYHSDPSLSEVASYITYYLAVGAVILVRHMRGLRMRSATS